MKYILLTILLFCTCLTVRSQIVAPVLSAGNHPTLDSVVVAYMPVSTTALSQSSIDVKAEISVKLKNNANTDRICLQVLHRSDSSIIYNVNYALTAAPYSSQGELLFSMQNGKFRILCPTVLPLSSFIYKVYTRNGQGINSPVFITRQ